MPKRLFAAIVGCWMAVSAAGAEELACVAPAKRHVIAELMFGRNIGEVLGVSDEAWSRFIDEEVTPRFPDGLTVLDAYGQWRDTASGRIVREPGKLLRIILTDGAAEPKLQEITEAYKRRFQQQSVILTLSRACVAF